MHYRFQHTLEIFNTLFQHAFNIVCNMHCRFQHALQISTCAEIFNMLFQDVFNTFQTWNSPMLWTMLKTTLKTMSNISKCVENYVENFKACWKPCWKFQSVSKITMMWPLCDPFHQFWNIIAAIKIKSDIINEDYSPYGATCEVWLKSCVVLKRKLGLFVCNSSIMCMLWKIFEFNLAVNFLYFLSNWVNLLGIFSGIRKLRTFERNPYFWNTYLMPWRWIIELLWECWKILFKFFSNKNDRKWKARSTSINDFMYFYSFMKHYKGMNWKLKEFQTTIRDYNPKR